MRPSKWYTSRLKSTQPKFSVFCLLIMFILLQRSGNSWSLHLSNSSKRDAGLYECQINTEPKIHLPFHLSVSGEYFFSTFDDSYFFKELIKNIFIPVCVSHVTPETLRHHFEGFKPRHKRPYSTSLLTLSTKGPYFRAISLQLDFLLKKERDNLNHYVKFQHRHNIWSTVSLKVDTAHQ